MTSGTRLNVNFYQTWLLSRVRGLEGVPLFWKWTPNHLSKMILYDFVRLIFGMRHQGSDNFSDRAHHQDPSSLKRR